MVKLLELISIGSEKIKKVAENPRLEARIFLSHILNVNPSDLFLKQEELADQDTINQFNSFIEKRAKAMPVAYITGHKEFFGLDFLVDETILIPRPETEFLVEEILSYGGNTLLDLCTGSGCIPIAAVKNSDLIAKGVDISESAISVATKNAKKHSANVEFEVCDILLEDFFGKFDIISSNPPYITGKAMKELSPDVINFEPSTALYGGEDGLDFYKRIIAIAPQNLNPKGRLIFELGIGQAEAVKKLLEKDFEDIKIIPDLAGIDRVISARIKF